MVSKSLLYVACAVVVSCAICAAAWLLRPGGGQEFPSESPTTTRAANPQPTTSRTRPVQGHPDLVELDIGVGPDAVTRATPGNPKGIKPPHLRPQKRREPFKVRPGMTNLALYKPVTACTDEPLAGDVDQITDGLKKSGPFDYVELEPGLGWVQIDLEQARTIHAVVIWHFYKNATIYNDVIVRLADDAAFTRNVRTLFNNDHDGSAKMGKGGDSAFYTRWWGEIVDARGAGGAGTRARYVRVYTAAGMEDELPRFVEIAVYGK